MANFDNKPPHEVLELGLDYVGIATKEQQRKTHDQLLDVFRDHYGCLPVDLAQLWGDLQTTDINTAKLNEKEKTQKGFKMFMAANFFLWTHPKNAALLSSRFHVCKRYIQSNTHLWKWILKLSALMDSKVLWDEALLGADDYAMFIGSVDGVDFYIWEKPNNRYNIDRGLMSYKSRHTQIQSMRIWHGVLSHFVYFVCHCQKLFVECTVEINKSA